MQRGDLPDLSAVMPLKVAGQQGKAEFRAEVRSIGTIQHKNLAKLIGSCGENNERSLVNL
jgi:hypothetical protein